jgi:RNA polymerase sigma factor (sigma-70 family)
MLHSPYIGEVQDASVSLGPESGLERLFETEARRIWRALVAYTGDREVASDAMAEAFAQALARGNELRSPERWVWRAAFRIAAGEAKATLRDRPISEDPGYEMPEPPHDLIAALAKLSPKQRAALILRHYAGYSTREVGQILGSSAATVRVHLSQGRRRLRHLLEVS